MSPASATCISAACSCLLHERPTRRMAHLAQGQWLVASAAFVLRSSFSLIGACRGHLSVLGASANSPALGAAGGGSLLLGGRGCFVSLRHPNAAVGAIVLANGDWRMRCPDRCGPSRPHLRTRCAVRAFQLLRSTDRGSVAGYGANLSVVGRRVGRVRFTVRSGLYWIISRDLVRPRCAFGAERDLPILYTVSGTINGSFMRDI